MSGYTLDTHTDPAFCRAMGEICLPTLYIPDNEWESLNSRGLPQTKARRTKAIKTRTMTWARDHKHAHATDYRHIRNSPQVRVIVIAHMRSARYDLDNLTAAAKPVIDALRATGYLADDNCRIITAYDLRPGQPCTHPGWHGIEIHIQPLGQEHQ